MTRSRLFISLAASAIAAAVFCSPALADGSSASAYGGQGFGVTPLVPHSTSTGALPFTGLDVGLVFGAAFLLLAAGAVLRWRLSRTGRGDGSA
jgi:hypothetical protein